MHLSYLRAWSREQKTRIIRSLAFYVKAGLDGTGATNSVQKIVSGLRWKLVQEPVLFHGEFKQDFLEEAETLGAGMAEGLKLGIF